MRKWVVLGHFRVQQHAASENARKSGALVPAFGARAPIQEPCNVGQPAGPGNPRQPWHPRPRSPGLREAEDSKKRSPMHAICNGKYPALPPFNANTLIIIQNRRLCGEERLHLLVSVNAGLCADRVANREK